MNQPAFFLMWIAFTLMPSFAHATGCSSPAGGVGQFQWMAGNADYEFCNGTNWISSDSGVNASTCSRAGTVQYQSASTDLQFCDGTNWHTTTSTLSNGSCAGTSAGTFHYNSLNSWEEWCDGTTWWVMYAQPSLNLNFMTGTLPAPVQFSRATGSNYSPGTYFNSSGTLITAPINLALQSQSLTTSPWSTSNATATASSSTAPDGTTTAVLLTENTATTQHYLQQNISGVAAQPYTLSFYAKAYGTDRNIGAVIYNSTNGNCAGADYNLLTGTQIGSTIAGTTSITSVGSGWYRLSFTCTPSVAGNSLQIKLLSASNTTYTGNGLSGTYIWGVQYEQGSTASSYTYTTSSAAYGPRFDYNPSTLALNGLLLEEASTNLITTSTFAITNNTGGNASLVASASVTNPDSTAAVKLVENTATSRHFASQYATVTANAASSYSVFLKAGERTMALIYAGKSGSPYTRGGMIVNLLTGTFTNADVGSPLSVTNRSVTAVGNGWYRITMTVTIDSSSTDGYLEVNTDNGTTSYTGDGSSGLYVWGAQIEALPLPTSYIPTSGTSLTRASDVAQVTNLSWLNNGQGTLSSQFRYSYQPSNRNFSVAGLYVDSTNTSVLDLFAGSGSAAVFRVYGGGTNNIYLTGQTFSTAQVNSVAASYNSANFFARSTNGVLAQTSTAATQTIPTGLTSLAVGTRFSGGVAPLDGWIRSVQYYPFTMNASELQQLTTMGLP